MDYRVANTIEVLNRATSAIWYEMPEEVSRLRTRRGTKGYGWPMIICAEENTRAFADDMAVLRNAGRDQSLDLETLKQLVRMFCEAQMGILHNWYGLDDSVDLVRSSLDALDHIKTHEEYLAYTHELSVYLGRLHWWADTLVPWDDISARYADMDLDR